ncbi:MAG TPA: hypothetical protein VE998_10580, partial [Terriglobales bacterium]|nr:hypothetical protein [Terriglobales bacterium]
MTRAVIAALCGAVAICAAGQRAGAPAAGAENEVRRLSQEEIDGFLKKDPQVVERLWSDDFVV